MLHTAFKCHGDVSCSREFYLGVKALVKFRLRKPRANGTAGGHTAEMLTLLRGLDPTKYASLTFVVAATDRMGAAKAQQALSLRGQPEVCPLPAFDPPQT